MADASHQSKLGPFLMPWQAGHAEEILLWVIAALFGSIVGATIVGQYRAHRGG